MSEKRPEDKSALISQDIIAAYDWYKKAPQSAIKDADGKPTDKTWAEKAEEDLMNKLTRAEFDWDSMPPAAKIGIDLEKVIARHARIEKLAGSPHMQQMIAECIGGDFQKKLSKGMTIAGEKCYLFGKADVWFADKIIDIKTTKAKPGKAFDPDKYAQNFQGFLYSYLNGTKQFDYLVAELTPDATEANPTIKAVHTVEAGFWGKPESLEKIIVDKTTWFLEGLKADGLFDVYKETYCMY